MQIDWWTLALQAINFLVLVWLLWRFLYRPVREVIEKRKALADRAFAEAGREREEAEAARRRFEDDRARLAQEREAMLGRIHEEQEAERRKILAAARQEADRIAESARKSIGRERETVLDELREQVVELAADLASDLLRKAAPDASDIFLAQLEKHLQDLPADERKRLRNDLAAAGARLTVVTATPLEPEDRDRWIERLGAHFDRRTETEFAVDPRIIGGAELRFPHIVLKLTWADQLRRARNQLVRHENAS